MTRLNVLLLLAVIASALLLVGSAYDTRRLFDAIHRGDMESQRLTGERLRLEAERQTQATNLRVEARARERLFMRTTTPAVTKYIVDPGAQPVAPKLASAAAPSTPSPSGEAR